MRFCGLAPNSVNLWTNGREGNCGVISKSNIGKGEAVTESSADLNLLEAEFPSDNALAIGTTYFVKTVCELSCIFANGQGRGQL